MRIWGLVAVLLLVPAGPAAAGEIARLGPGNWNLAPRGKEVDAIYGDYLLRNDRVAAVVGDPVAGRHAHLSCRNIQGAVIDFTLLEANNDQLTAFKPHGESAPGATEAEILAASGAEVRLRVTRPATGAEPVEAVTDYVLRDGEPFLRITTRYRNTGAGPVQRRLSDKIRCDQTFTQTPEGEAGFIHFYDRWFHAAYAVARLGGMIYTNGRFGGMGGANSGTWLDFPDMVRDATTRTSTLAPGQEVTLTRCLTVGRHPGDTDATAYGILGRPSARLAVTVQGPGGEAVEGAEITVRQGEREVSAAHTDGQGRAILGLAAGRCTVRVSQMGRQPVEKEVEVQGDSRVTIPVSARSQVTFTVTDGAGRPSPCKAQFLGVGGTPEPDLGPEQRANGCKNLYFSADGRFTVPLPPGRYYVLLSRGPEYDAVYRYVNLNSGQTARISARLVRVVDTRGWVAADFHNHSTESGDNTTETESRILCLAGEGLEFTPSTEHNRIQTYRHRLKALGLERLLATSDGIELTGSPLPLNHQNAFPLKLRPGAQDGGGPQTDPDPRAQIRRLFEHDGMSEKLVQQNHPDIGWLFYDRDGDGRPDMGFGTFEFTHAIEVWATNILAMRPTTTTAMGVRNNRIFNWLQLLNQGFRLPGVANTDAHYCFHQSGVIRNYMKSRTDDPARIDEMEMVREARKGRLVMSNGPFLEAAFNGALPGEDARARRRRGRLRVRVQCPNWLDVDRVQVLVNGRPDPKLNFTRESHPQLFGDGVVKFQHEIPVSLERDAHLIVVAAGERSTTGPVMGHRGDPPLAVSNPIYVDVDGGGFQANKDTLDAPLPTKKS
jgi:carboxypeptidase family protein